MAKEKDKFFLSQLSGSAWRLSKFLFESRSKIFGYFLLLIKGKKSVCCDLFRILNRFFSSQQQIAVYASLSKFKCLPADMYLFEALYYSKSGAFNESVLVLNRILNLGKKISVVNLDYLFFQQMLQGCINYNSHLSLQDLFEMRTVRDRKKIERFLLSNLQESPDSIFKKVAHLRLKEVGPSFFSRLKMASAADVATVVYKLSPRLEISFYEPKCFEESSSSEIRKAEIPEQNVILIENCSIIGGFQIIKDNKFVVYESAADPKNGMIAGVWPFVSYIKNLDEVIVDFEFKEKREYEEGILISGRCTRNYFHWLIEYLPKIKNILDAGIDRNIPLVVDDEMPMQHYELLGFVAAKYGLKVLRISSENLNVFKRLYVPSPATYLPDDAQFPYWMGAGISKEHIRFVRDMGLEYAFSKDNAQKGLGGRYYLSRRGNSARRMKNERQLEKLLAGEGFEIVDPSTMSFSDQVVLFHNASLIMSPAGAGLANVIFCRSNVKVFSILADYNRGYSIQGNLAEAFGISYSHFCGHLVGTRDMFSSEDEFRFSSFSLDIDKMKRLLHTLSIEN